MNNHFSQSGQNFSQSVYLCRKNAQKKFKNQTKYFLRKVLWFGREYFSNLGNFLLTPKTYYFLESDPYNIMHAFREYIEQLKSVQRVCTSCARSSRCKHKNEIYLRNQKNISKQIWKLFWKNIIFECLTWLGKMVID